MSEGVWLRRSSVVRKWFVAVFLMALIVAALPAVGQAAGPTGTIAYVRGNNTTGDEIWLTQPDGSGDHRIFTTGRADPNDLLFVQALTWKHDASELAFASNHENYCSIFKTDIFAVRPDGGGYRRITEAPACPALASYPQGSVTVPVRNDSGQAGTFLVYLEGAPTAKPITLLGNGSGEVTFEQVADFGNQMQFAVGIEGNARYLGFAPAGVDVKAGQSVRTSPELHVGSNGFESFSNVWPTWRLSGDRIAYVFGEGTMRVLPANPVPLAAPSTLLAPNAASLLGAARLNYGPTADRANQVLYFGLSYQGWGIWLVSEGAADAGQQLISMPCCNEFVGLSWLPDGSGFVYSATEGDFLNDKLRGNIFEYDFATNEIKRVTDFPDGFTGDLSVSPDGSRIVFERVRVFGQGPSDLWMVNRDGSNAQLFKQNASAPAWSRGDVPPPPARRPTFLPFILR